MLPLAHLAIGLGAALLVARVRSLPRSAPYLAMLGAILPDLVDKTLALVVQGWDQHSRGPAHTLAFALLLAALSIGRIRLASLTLGVFTHILADWPPSYPRTFLWPLGGPGFSVRPFEGLGSLWSAYLERGNAIPELLGAAFLAVALALYELGVLRSQARRSQARDRRFRDRPMPKAHAPSERGAPQPVQESASTDSASNSSRDPPP